MCAHVCSHNHLASHHTLPLCFSLSLPDGPNPPNITRNTNTNHPNRSAQLLTCVAVLSGARRKRTAATVAPSPHHQQQQATGAWALLPCSTLSRFQPWGQHRVTAFRGSLRLGGLLLVVTRTCSSLVGLLRLVWVFVCVDPSMLCSLQLTNAPSAQLAGIFGGGGTVTVSLQGNHPHKPCVLTVLFCAVTPMLCIAAFLPPFPTPISAHTTNFTTRC